MAEPITLNMPLNRVEGDLNLEVTLTDGVVTGAQCSGTLFRGFERMLEGRSPLDALVITPRICGICSTAHLSASSRALDQLCGVEVPPDAVRVRNIALMIENIQSDLRHSFLMFCPDFANERYRDQPLHAEAVRRYQPFGGETVAQVVAESKRVVEIIALLGGQWPHTHFMVPGGIASTIGPDEVMRCRLLLSRFRKWYESRVLGCSVERWLDVRRAADLDVWLDESPQHRDSELGFYLRFARAVGLDQMGRGHGNFISYGGFDLPQGTLVRGPQRGSLLVPAGFAEGIRVETFDQANITEDLAYSWFADAAGPLHPSAGSTEPYATGREGSRYSWAKAPRYRGLPAETGPLAEMVVGGHPLYSDLVRRHGPSAFVRQLARIVRTAELLPALQAWLTELHCDAPLYRAPDDMPDGEAFGLIEAARGGLGHWTKVKDGVIAGYQVIAPTGWHASPRDSSGYRGTTEEALIGTPVADPDNPVELGHVVRSFDHCLVCTVHVLRRGRADLRLRIT